jgi:predicted signal transduction protein with EAL and GGDEF domain
MLTKTRPAARALASSASLTLLMMDLDQLKHIKDTFGHQAGTTPSGTVATATDVRERLEAKAAELLRQADQRLSDDRRRRRLSRR